MLNVFRPNSELQGTHRVTVNAAKFIFNTQKCNNFRQNFKPRFIFKTLKILKLCTGHILDHLDQHSFHQVENFPDTHREV